MVNELVTNALRHAWLRDGAGTLAVTVEARGDRLHAGVEDDGDGMPQSADDGSTKSFGVDLRSTTPSCRRGRPRRARDLANDRRRRGCDRVGKDAGSSLRRRTAGSRPRGDGCHKRGGCEAKRTAGIPRSPRDADEGLKGSCPGVLLGPYLARLCPILIAATTQRAPDQESCSLDISEPSSVTGHGRRRGVRKGARSGGS